MGHRMADNDGLMLLEERANSGVSAFMPPARALPLAHPTFFSMEQQKALDEEANLPLITGRARAPQSPELGVCAKKHNICLWSCMSTLLVVLIMLAATSSARNERLEDQYELPDNDSHPPPAAPPPSLFRTPSPAQDYRGKPRRVAGDKGMVAADQGQCADIGAKILQVGGNAVDAAVATCLCQGVLNPFASGIGGGFFAVIRGANGSSEFIDARETAPAAASKDMYKGLPPEAVYRGGLAIAVPLELKGLELMWQRWGKLPWARLVAPAAALARSGFAAYPYFVYSATRYMTYLQSNPLAADAFLVRTTSGKGAGAWRAPRVGEPCCARASLADTLDAVGQFGAQWLYQQERAETMAAEISAAGGIMTAQDMINTQPAVGAVLKMQVGGYELLLPPPPSSAAVMGLALRILTGFKKPLDNTPNRWTGPGNATQDQLLFEHHLVESLKQAFAVRLALGDPGPATGPAFANITAVFADIIDPAFADDLRSDIIDNGILNMTKYGRQWNPFNNNTGAMEDDGGTSHLCVVDSQGLAVSLTTTVNGPFGANVISKSTGILWNNEMDDFSLPDRPNAYGLHPAVPNFIAPGKRPLSSMSPTIITEGGQLRMVVGASNGPRIISATLQTIVRILLLGWDPLDAVSSARLHHQLLPYSVSFENYTMPDYSGDLAFKASVQLQRYLSHKGDQLKGEGDQLGNSQVIYIPPGSNTLIGASDPRKDGAPAAP